MQYAWGDFARALLDCRICLMTIVKTEFALAINQVATERGISVDDVLQSIESAVLAAYKKEYPEKDHEGVEARINSKTGEVTLIYEENNVTPPGFGRIAAQTARQVIIQKVREAEKKKVVNHYQEQVGTLIRGRVIRTDHYNAYVDIGKAEAILPREEQMKTDHYSSNASFTFYLKEIREDRNGYTRIIISRASAQLVEKLFEREVPEIANETVEIKNAVREPGERAKIAVHSGQGGVDPVGACVGQKGIRVQTVTDEIGGVEKIDIIQWSEDPKVFLIAALAPAKIEEVQFDETKRNAKVTVHEDQAPLAIGRGGVNVNLASRLTGYEIDIIQIRDNNKVADSTEGQSSVNEDSGGTPQKDDANKKNEE